MQPDSDLGRMVKAELAARGTTPSSFAKKAHINDRTMRAYVLGKHPIPPDAAHKLIVALDEETFVFPEVREALVIRGRRHDGRNAPNLIEPARLFVDSVILTIEVTEERRDALTACIQAHLHEQPKGDNRLPGYSKAAHDTVGEATVTAHWSPWNKKSRWLRVQLAAWEPAHCRLLQLLLRCACARSPRGLLTDHPVVRFARLDVAVDYRAEPSWLLLHRPRAHTYRVLESADGVRTVYAGRRKDGDLYVRLYDCARHHDLPSPRARVEAERHFRKQITPTELRAVSSPFHNVELGALFCPSLTPHETALLRWAQEHGARWALGQLDDVGASVLRDGLGKASGSTLLDDPKAVLDRVWRYLPELLLDQLFWHEFEDGDLQPWSYPPVPTAHDWSDHGPALSP